MDKAAFPTAWRCSFVRQTASMRLSTIRALFVAAIVAFRRTHEIGIMNSSLQIRFQCSAT